MNLNFKEIELYNFMSFEKATIKLDDVGFVKVVGNNNNPKDAALSNGSGKSAIWDALNWVITGETLRGSKDIVRHQSEDGTYVKLSFCVDNDFYVITRSKNHIKYKTNLFIYKNDENKSGKGIRDTEQLLAQYLPDINSELINAVILLGQGLPFKFTNNTPSGRKEILEKLSKSDFMIEDLKNRVSSRKSELDSAAQCLRDSNIKLTAEYNIYSNDLSKKESKLTSLESIDTSELEAEKTNLQKNIEKITNEINGIINYEEQDLDNKITDLLKQSSSVWPASQEKINVITSKFNESKLELSNKCAELKSTINFKQKEIEKLKSIGDICPTCGQKMPSTNKIDITNMESDLHNLEDEYYLANEQLGAVEEELAKLVEEEKETRDCTLTSINSQVDSLKQTKLKLSSLNDDLLRYKNRVNEIDSVVNNKNADISSCKANIIEIKNVLKDLEDTKLKNDEELQVLTNKLNIQKEFETALKRDFRGILLQSCIYYMDSKAKQYCQDIFDNSEIKFELDGNSLSISYLDKEYESLSGGEKQKIDLIIQFSLRDMLCKYLNFSCNLLILDELTDNLDILSCNKIINFVTKELNDIDSIFMISHRTDLDIPYDSLLTVIKNESGISNVL